MGHKNLILLLLVLSFALVSCSSVRKNLIQPPERKPGGNSSQNDIKPGDEVTPTAVEIVRPKKEYQKARTAPDTVFLHLVQSSSNVKSLTEINKAGAENSGEDVSVKLSRAVKLFDDEMYDDAKLMFIQLIAETPDGQPEKYEAHFYLAEYDIAKKNFSSAEFRLGEMLANKSLPDTVREKVLVRLGQVYCLDNQKQKSATYYKMLKKEYPESRYIPLAVCPETGKN